MSNKSKWIWVLKLINKDKSDDLPMLLTYKTRKEARSGLKNLIPARKHNIKVSMHKANITPAGAILVLHKIEY